MRLSRLQVKPYEVVLSSEVQGMLRNTLRDMSITPVPMVSTNYCIMQSINTFITESQLQNGANYPSLLFFPSLSALRAW